MSLIGMFWVHTATVQTYQGDGAYSDSFAEASAPIAGFMDDTAHFVKTANNEEIVSNSTFYTDIANTDLFTANSLVTSNGRTSRVISVNANDGGGLGLPDHLEVHLV